MIRRFAQADRGVALVEFALVAPVLILILLGILDAGRAINAYVTIANSAREGAHYAALHPTAAPSDIAAAVRARVAPLNDNSVSVSASYFDGSTLRPWPSGGIPASSPVPAYLATQVRVTYPWSAVTALIGTFFPATSITAASSMDTLR